MALELEVAKIKNTVTFQVDKNSLAASKKVVEDFAKMKASLSPVINTANAKKQIAELSAEWQKLQKQANTPISPKVVPPTSPPSNQGSGNPPRRGTGAGRPATSDEEREARNYQRRSGQADVRRSSFGFEASRLTDVLSADRLQNAGTQADSITNSFREGKITAQSMNEQLRQQLSLLRQEAAVLRRNNTELARAERQAYTEDELRSKRKKAEDDRQERAIRRQNDLLRERRRLRRERIGNGLLSGNGGMVAGALGVGAAAMGIGSLFGNIQSAADRNNLLARGASNVETDPNVLAAITLWGQSNGVDSANIKKQIDNAKDVRERLASSVMSAQLNKKGQWAGGDSGVDQIMNTFGWTPQQIKQFQSRPMDFVQATVNEGQRRGLSDAEIGHLLENLGDDMMHYVQMYKNGAEGYREAMKILVDTGAWQTDETAKNAEEFTKLSFTISKVGEGFSNSMLNGFMESFDSSIIKNKSTWDTINDAGRSLGESLGKSATQIAEFAEFFNKLNDPNSMFAKVTNWLQPSQSTADTIQDGMNGISPTNDGKANMDIKDPFVSTHSGLLGWIDNWINNAHVGDGVFDEGKMTSNNSLFLSQAGYQSSNPNALPNLNITLTPQWSLPEGLVTITPDADGFSNLINAKTSFNLDAFNTGTILNINSGTSTR